MDKDVTKWLSTLHAKVEENLEVLTPEELGQDYLIHISSNTNIRKFIPVIGFRQAKTEDRTVPRICTAPSILGCMIGYAQFEHDFFSNTHGQKFSNTGKDVWKGGYKIYTFPFRHCFRPNKKLVYDQSITDEIWLTSYNQDTVEYIPEAAGKMFIASGTYYPDMGKGGNPGLIEMYVEVTREQGLLFSKNIFLEKGYWKILTPSIAVKNGPSWKNDKAIQVEKIDKGTYGEVKTRSASLLSHDAPSYMHWSRM